MYNVMCKHRSERQYWLLKSYATKAEANARIERDRKVDAEYGQAWHWNYHIEIENKNGL